MFAEQESDGESACEPRKHGRDGVLRVRSAFDFARDKVPDDLGVRLAFEGPAFGDELVAERLEILDDAVVDERNLANDVRVSVADGRSAVGRPARVGDSGDAVQWTGRKLAREILELALGAAADELAILDRANAGRV